MGLAPEKPTRLSLIINVSKQQLDIVDILRSIEMLELTNRATSHRNSHSSDEAISIQEDENGTGEEQDSLLESISLSEEHHLHSKHASVSLEQEMDTIGEGYFHRRMVMILGLGNIADAVEILAMGYILTAYDLPLTPLQSSLLTGACFCGMLLGGLESGLCCDVVGRRKALLVHLSLNGFAGLCASLAPSTAHLILCRFVAGIGVGGTVTCLFTLCVEHLPARARGRYVSILCSFWMVGSIFAAGLAWLVLAPVSANSSAKSASSSWRTFAFIAALPSLMCLALTFIYIPESPRYLMARGKVQETEKILTAIHRLHENQNPVENNARSTKLLSESVEDQSLVLWQALFHPPYLALTFVLMTISFCQSFGSYGLATYIPTLFCQVGLLDPYMNALLYSGANLPGNVFSILLIDRLGRKTLLAGSMFGAALASLLFAINTDSKTQVVFMACLFNASATSAWNAYGVISAESFPTSFRASGLSILNAVGRLGAIAAQFVNGFLVGPPAHVATLLTITALTMCIGGACARALPRETSSTAGPGTKKRVLISQR